MGTNDSYSRCERCGTSRPDSTLREVTSEGTSWRECRAVAWCAAQRADGTAEVLSVAVGVLDALRSELGALLGRGHG